MTREEKERAIYALKKSAPIMAVTHEEFGTYIQTLNQVMDWLEQEPCEDCISREAVFKKQYRIDDSETLLIRDVVNVEDIEDLPPVTPQPKIGHWILIQRDKCIDINCSECGNTRFKDYAYGHTIDELNLDEINDLLTKIRMNYCECCGAKMVGVRK